MFQMFQAMFKSRENWDFNQGNGACEQGCAGSLFCSVLCYDCTVQL